MFDNISETLNMGQNSAKHKDYYSQEIKLSH